MKQLISILIFTALAFSVEAQTVLTDAQKETLYADGTFKYEVKWAILNKAAYWVGLDGTSLPGGQGAANLDKWRKNKSFGNVLQNNPQVAENDLYVKQFLVYVKTTPVWQGSSTATVSYMLTNSIFDTLADTWFANQVAVAGQ